MKKKMNVQLIVISLITVGLTLCFTLIAINTALRNMIRSDLRSTAAILDKTGVFNQKNKDNFKFDEEETRITWIAADGSVLYDNDVDANGLENHLERPEVKGAIKDGEAYAERKSSTLGVLTFYYARQMADGTILRVSKRVGVTFDILKGMIPYLALIVILIVALSTALAHFFTKSLLAPIDDMARNIDKYPVGTVYKELRPFMKTIRDQHENLLKSAKMRQDFTANVSHELKTPLTVISGYAELIENGMVEGPDVKTFAAKIRKSTERLLSLINDIIRLSELDTVEEATQLEKIDLQELAEQCVENLQISAEKHDVMLSCIGSHEIVTANKDMIYEVMCNLCDNGIRYNNRGGKVEIRTSKKDGHAFFEVRDNGIGISKEHQERVFERFYRVDKSRSKATGGTGLGLAIVKHIAAIHNAEIILESEKGRGTRIMFIF